jgi:Arm DNA-binding domain
MRQLLTDRTLQTLEFKGKPETVWDTNLKGFGIRLLKTAKTFTVMRGKQRERITIGRYPEWSLKDARKEAQALLAAPPRKNAAMPIAQALKQFIELHCHTWTYPEKVEGRSAV